MNKENSLFNFFVISNFGHISLYTWVFHLVNTSQNLRKIKVELQHDEYTFTTFYNEESMTISTIRRMVSP